MISRRDFLKALGAGVASIALPAPILAQLEQHLDAPVESAIDGNSMILSLHVTPNLDDAKLETISILRCGQAFMRYSYFCQDNFGFFAASGHEIFGPCDIVLSDKNATWYALTRSTNGKRAYSMVGSGGKASLART